MIGHEHDKTANPVASWYVLHTRSRFENVVNEGLLKKSTEVFLPKIRVRSKRRDRKKMIQVPMFPGYIFVRTTLDSYSQLDIVKTIGVVRFIGNRQGPVPVPSENIESLKIMVAADLAVSTGTRFRKGNRIMVTAGPFAGITGTFIRYKGMGRVVVYIEVLGQYASVEVDEDDIEILPEIIS
ncbi:MAG: UpxY family transcription antiterminator [Desulfobacteraceae bacterium]|nr:UpxY family transcription antiterminator [Desulfobacteraceae bacterium]